MSPNHYFAYALAFPSMMANMQYVRKFWRFVVESGKEELFWKCVGWVTDHYLVGGSALLVSLGISIWAWVESAPAIAAAIVFVILFSLLLSAANACFKLQGSSAGTRTAIQAETRPLKMVGVVEESQISFWAQFNLQINIAVKFENSEATQRFIRGFSAYIVGGGSKEKLEAPRLMKISAQSEIVKLDNGHAVQPGVSSLYYVMFNVPSFEKEDQTFEIEMEALGQPLQRIEIVPNWANIQPLLLNAKTVKEIRYLN